MQWQIRLGSETLFLTSDTADGQLDMQAVLYLIECLKSMSA